MSDGFQRWCQLLRQPCSQARARIVIRSALLALFAFLLSVQLIACTPSHDWRVLRLAPQNQALTLEFPAKPQFAQRSQQLAGQAVAFQLSATQVGAAQYALGSAPATDAANAQALAQAMAAGFANNLKLAPAVPKAVVLTQALGAIDVDYSSAQRSARARFIWTAGAAYQLIVLGPVADAPSETAEQFIRSLRFE